MTQYRHDEHEWRQQNRPQWIAGRHWMTPPRTRNHKPSLLVRIIRAIIRLF